MQRLHKWMKRSALPRLPGSEISKKRADLQSEWYLDIASSISVPYLMSVKLSWRSVVYCRRSRLPALDQSGIGGRLFDLIEYLSGGWHLGWEPNTLTRCKVDTRHGWRESHTWIIQRDVGQES